MRLTRTTLVALTMALLVAAAGCSSSGGGGGGGGSQATPKDTVLKMFDAMESGNKAAFKACLKTKPEEEKMVDAMFSTAHSMYKLQASVRDKYGEDGLRQFNDASGNGEDGSGLPTRADLEKMTVTMGADKTTAKANMPKQGEPMDLVLEGGKWYATLPEGATAEGPMGEMAVKMAESMVKAVDDTRALVGKSGQTPETLAKALGENMMKAMMGGSGMPMPPMDE